MKKTISLIIAGLFTASSSYAFEAQEAMVAPQNSQIDVYEEIDLSGDIINSNPSINPQNGNLIPSFVSVKYLAPNSNFDESGYEVEAGLSIKNIEFNAGYRDFSIDAVEMSQIRAGVYLPVISNSQYAIQLGATYARSELSAASKESDSIFVTAKIKSHLSKSIIAHGAVDFEVSDENPIIGGAEYDIHETTTFRVGMDYNITENIALGANLSFGSEFDENYSIQASYKF